MHDFTDMTNVVVDHCSATWATDENLTCTHVNHATVSGVSFVSLRAAGISCTAGKVFSVAQPDSRIAATITAEPAHARLAMRRLLLTLVPVGPTWTLPLGTSCT